MPSAGRARRRRWIIPVVAVSALVFAPAIVIWIEVQVAGSGVKLDERDPHTIDGRVDESASGDGSRNALRMVWFGDSLAAGVGTDSPEGSVARQVARRLRRPIEVEVLAVSGATIADVVGKQLPLLEGTPDVVVISVGANDATHLTSLEGFEASYRAFFAGLPPTSTVVVLGVPDMGAATRLAQPLRGLAGFRANQLDVVAHDVARAHDSAYVNIAAQTGPSFRADPDSNFSADHYHPSDAGYTVWADAITPVIEWALVVREHPELPVPPLPEEST